MVIPSAMIRNRIPLSWKDVLWGYNRQMLGWSAVVELAMDRLTDDTNNPLEIELAGLQKSDAYEAGQLLQTLASREAVENIELSKRKWLYLVLSWLFEERGSFTDPLS